MVLQYRRDRLLFGLCAKRHNRAAGLLNMSTRTLHRQLKEEGASPQQLKDEVPARAREGAALSQREAGKAGGDGDGVSE